MASLGAEQRERRMPTRHLLIAPVRPSAGPLGDTNHIRDFTDSNVMIVELGLDRISLHESLSFYFLFLLELRCLD